MRAKLGLAICLWERNEREEALKHLREMLHLNPNDNQGVRSILAAYLIESSLHDELAALLKAYKDDTSANLASVARCFLFAFTEIAPNRERRSPPQSNRTNTCALISRARRRCRNPFRRFIHGATTAKPFITPKISKRGGMKHPARVTGSAISRKQPRKRLLRNAHRKRSLRSRESFLRAQLNDTHRRAFDAYLELFQA